MTTSSQTRSQVRKIRALFSEMEALMYRADAARCRLRQHVAKSHLIRARHHRMILHLLQFRAPFKRPGATCFWPRTDPLSAARFEQIDELIDIFGWRFDAAEGHFTDRAGKWVDSHAILVAIPSLLPVELDAYIQRQTVPAGGRFARRLLSGCGAPAAPAP